MLDLNLPGCSIHCCSDPIPREVFTILEATQARGVQLPAGKLRPLPKPSEHVLSHSLHHREQSSQADRRKSKCTGVTDVLHSLFRCSYVALAPIQFKAYVLTPGFVNSWSESVGFSGSDA